MTSGIIWETSPEAVFPRGVEEWLQSINEAVYQLMLFRAPQISSWMRLNASWQDRTGNARQSLYAEVERALFEITVWIAYGAAIDYAVYLEFAHAGKYSILSPALDYWIPILWNDVKALLA